MSVLPDYMIAEYCQKGMVAPFESKYINPASLDLTLWGEIVEITSGGIVDASKPHNYTSQRKIKLQYGQSYLLQPGTFILASSVEVINLPPNLAAEVKLKSTTARSGIGHVFAGWIDPGFRGQITFELFSHIPVTLKPGMPICQIAFMEMLALPNKPYQGKYQNQVGPTPARHNVVLEPAGSIHLGGAFTPFLGLDDLIGNKPFIDKGDVMVRNPLYPAEDIGPKITALHNSIDQVWVTPEGTVVVKTPRGMEYTLTKLELIKRVSNAAPGFTPHDVIQMWIASIVEAEEAIKKQTDLKDLTAAIAEDFSDVKSKRNEDEWDTWL